MSHIDIRDLGTAAAAKRAATDKALKALAVPKSVEDYQTKVKPDYDLDIQPVQTVVVSQDPDPGATVPQGTEVTVVLAPKTTLPIDIFLLDDAITGTYANQNVGIVIDDVKSKDPATKALLDDDKDFGDLTSEDKKKVKTYAEDNLGFTGDDTKLKGIYDDLKFLNNF